MTAFPVVGVRGPFVVSAQAQVPAIAVEPGNAEKQKDARALSLLQKSLKDVETVDPEGALKQYLAFLAFRPKIDPEAGILANHIIAQLVFKQGNVEGAQKIYDQAYAQYGDERASFGLLTEKAALLLSQDKNAEAEAMLTQIWPQVAKSESEHGEPTYAGPMLYQLSSALMRQQKNDQIVSLLENAFISVPGLLEDGLQGKTSSKFAGQTASKVGWMYDLLTSALNDQGKRTRALGWAKLRWMTCNFEDADVGRAARMLAKQWTIAQPKGESLLEFVAHQKSNANAEAVAEAEGYDKIALPTFDEAQLQTQLKQMQERDGRTSAGQSQEKVSLYILRGQWNEAMSEATTYLLQHPTSKARVQGVARVFKAADGDIIRANAFTLYLREGTGANPLAGFFKQYPKSASVTVPPPVPSSVLISQIKAVSGKAKTGAAYAAPIREAALTVPLLAMQANQSQNSGATVEAMWKQGLLSVDDALYALGRGGIDSDLLTENHDIKAQLAGLIVRHGQDIDEVELREPRVRLSIGDYYQRQNDLPRAIETFRSLVEQGKGRGTPNADGKAWRAWYYLVSLERLGGAYQAQGNNAAFEKLWLDAREDAGRGSEIYNSATLILARHYTTTQQEAKARQTYAELGNGSGWTMVMGAVDQANALVDKERYEPALEILQPFIAVSQVTENNVKDDTGRNLRLIRMAPLVLTGFTRYKLGQFDEATRLSDEALMLYQTSDITANLGMEGQAQTAKSVLKWSASWQKRPFYASPPALRFRGNSNGAKSETFNTQFLVCSHHDVPLIATCSDPRVKVVVADEVQKSNYLTTREVKLQIAPAALTSGLQTEIIISTSPATARREVRVPLSILPPTK